MVTGKINYLFEQMNLWITITRFNTVDGVCIHTCSTKESRAWLINEDKKAFFQTTFSTLWDSAVKARGSSEPDNERA